MLPSGQTGEIIKNLSLRREHILSQSRRFPLLQVVSNNKSFSVGVQSLSGTECRKHSDSVRWMDVNKIQMFTVKIHKVTEIEKNDGNCARCWKKKNVTFRIKCNVVCAKKIRYYISKPQNSCKNAQKSEKKMCKINEN